MANAPRKPRRRGVLYATALALGWAGLAARRLPMDIPEPDGGR
ncbi:hypothetical protein [Actinomadura rudentiformis]|nr:hypothetical protein [Actinomadura rudentiformis]